MIVLVHGDGEVTASDDWVSFTAYPAAAACAQACRFPHASSHWVSNLAAGSSQWLRVPAERCFRPFGVLLPACDRWSHDSDWRSKARHEEGLVQLVDDWRVAGVAVVLQVGDLKRQWRILRKQCDAIVALDGRRLSTEWFCNADVQSK